MKINKTNTSEIDRAKKNRGKTNTQREKHIHREKNAYTERKTQTKLRKIKKTRHITLQTHRKEQHKQGKIF